MLCLEVQFSKEWSLRRYDLRTDMVTSGVAKCAVACGSLDSLCLGMPASTGLWWAGDMGLEGSEMKSDLKSELNLVMKYF